MSASGITQTQIGEVIGITDRTLRKHYRHELDCGGVEATEKMAGKVYNTAMGNTQQALGAAIFWLKTRAGYRETGEPDDKQQGPPAVHIHFPDKK